MAVTVRDPNVIILAGTYELINDIVAGEAITPGQLVEKYSDGGVIKWRKSTSATAVQNAHIAMDQPWLNKTVDDACAAGDQIPVAILKPGGVFWGLIPSGQDIAIADYLQSNGDGNLKEATATTAAASVAKYQALDAPGAVTELSRVRVEVLW